VELRPSAAAADAEAAAERTGVRTGELFVDDAPLAVPLPAAMVVPSSFPRFHMIGSCILR
jgi:hypothetical protein